MSSFSFGANAAMLKKRKRIADATDPMVKQWELQENAIRKAQGKDLVTESERLKVQRDFNERALKIEIKQEVPVEQRNLEKAKENYLKASSLFHEQNDIRLSQENEISKIEDEIKDAETHEILVDQYTTELKTTLDSHEAAKAEREQKIRDLEDEVRKQKCIMRTLEMLDDAVEGRRDNRGQHRVKDYMLDTEVHLEDFGENPLDLGFRLLERYAAENDMSETSELYLNRYVADLMALMKHYYETADEKTLEQDVENPVEDLMNTIATRKAEYEKLTATTKELKKQTKIFVKQADIFKRCHKVHLQELEEYESKQKQLTTQKTEMLKTLHGSVKDSCTEQLSKLLRNFEKDKLTPYIEDRTVQLNVFRMLTSSILIDVTYETRPNDPPPPGMSEKDIIARNEEARKGKGNKSSKTIAAEFRVADFKPLLAITDNTNTGSVSAKLLLFHNDVFKKFKAEYCRIRNERIKKEPKSESHPDHLEKKPKIEKLSLSQEAPRIKEIVPVKTEKLSDTTLDEIICLD